MCISSKESCWDKIVYGSNGSGGASSSPAYPSTSSKVNLNPAAVPTDDELGIETIYYRGFDFALVKGTGRVGAAISPTNNEESFFGPPAFETNSDYLTRKVNKDKYQSQNYTLATAFQLYNNKRNDLGQFAMNLGVVLKYNKLLKQMSPGGGLSGVLGPLTFGYAYTGNQFAIDQGTSPAPGTDEFIAYNYSTTNLTAGLYLGSFVFDYSLVNVKGDGLGEFKINVYTMSLMLHRWILTGAARIEDSVRMAYDPETQSLVPQATKNEYFAGLQFAVFQHLIVGAFYNYYLLREYSFGGTYLF